METAVQKTIRSTSSLSSNSMHGCYLLRSLKPNSNKTYIGFFALYMEWSNKRWCRYTKGDPRRRLRQHNGEIKGGAASTRSSRPWQIELFIHGFPDRVGFKQSALLCSWMCDLRIKLVNLSGRGNVHLVNVVWQGDSKDPEN